MTITPIANLISLLRNAFKKPKSLSPREILMKDERIDSSLLQSPFSDDHWKAIRRELDDQNDRGAAIVGASLVDEHLRWALETRFIEDLSATRKDWIFNGNGPLATYSAKVELGYALGLYAEKLRSNLRQIGKIRNKFAHGIEATTFSNPEIVKLCKQFDFEGQVPQSLLDSNARHAYLLECFLAMGILFAMGNIKAFKHEPTS